MAENPVRHVTTVARAERRLAILVYERISLLHVIESLHQIDIRFTAPITASRVGKLLPVTGRAVEIDHHHHVTLLAKAFGVSARREQLRIPAIRPLVTPRPL